MERSNITLTRPGKPKVLITQTYKPNLAATYSKLSEYFDANIAFRSFTKVEFISLSQFRIHKPTVTEHTAFLFTGRAVLDGFFQFLKDCNIFLPKSTKYFLATEELQSHLYKYVELRKRKVFCGRKQLEDLFPIMYKHKKEKFLFPCSDLGRRTISDFYKKKKYHYTELPIYQNVYGDLTDLNPDDYDVIVFFSPFAIEAFVKNFPNYSFEKTVVAAFSERTVQTAKKQGWRVTIAAPTEKTQSMVGGLIEYFDSISAQSEETQPPPLVSAA